jgi:hypothetical protein
MTRLTSPRSPGLSRRRRSLSRSSGESMSRRRARLDAWGHRFADTYKALNKGVHAAHDGDLGLLTGDARRLADKIRDML